MSQARKNVNALRSLVQSIDAFGAVADGTTDNRAAFAAAVLEDGVIHLGAGTYVIDLPSGEDKALTIAAITGIVGLGRGLSVIRFTVSNNLTAERIMFSISSTGRLALADLSVEIVTTSTDAQTMFKGDGLSGLYIARCRLDGGVTDDGVHPSHDGYGIRFRATGTYEDVVVEDCDDIRRFTWFMVTAGATHNRIRVRGSRFREHYRTPLLLNSPNGVIDDVDIDGNSFEGGAGFTLGEPNCFHVAPMGNNVRIRHNRMQGIVDYAIHCEEKLTDCLIEGNQISCDAAGGGGGIRMINNNVGDGVTYVGPRRVRIASNTLTYLGTAKAAGTRGILLNNDGTTATVDNSEIDLVGNRLTGFEYGITGHGNLGDGIRAMGNYAINCGQGYRASGSQFVWRGNTSQDCDTGVYASSGGAFVDHTFIDCTSPAAHAARFVQLVNPRFEFSPVSVGGASSTERNTVLLGANDRVQCTVSAYALCDNSADSAWRAYTVTWDGATLTATSVQNRSIGGFSFTAVNNAGALSLRLASTNARGDVRVAVQFTGEALVG